MNQRKVINNAKWIIMCKIAQSLIQFVVGLLSARYLGPSNYGLINYAASVTAFFMPLMRLGMDATLVQEYGNRPDQEGRVLGTALVMNLLSAFACVICMTGFVAVANRGEITTILVCCLYSTALIFHAVEMVQYWFQAKLLSKHSSLAMLCAHVVVSAYKIWLLATNKSVYWFALSHSVEYFAISVLLVVAFRRNSNQKMTFSWAMARELFGKSKHYIIALLMIVVYGKTGNILLTLIHNETENGYFATAVTCTCIAVFVFDAIVDTARPVILESKKNAREDFEKNVSRVYALTTWLSIAQSVFFTLFAGIVVKILYGDAYLPAVGVLRILTWQGAFSYMGAVRNIWILAEEKHHLMFALNLIGAVVNVACNLVLIPYFGAYGAAVASLITQIFTNFILGFLWKPLRENNRLLVQGLDPRLLLDMAKLLIQRKSAVDEI